MIGGLIARPVECSTGPGQAHADGGEVGHAAGCRWRAARRSRAPPSRARPRARSRRRGRRATSAEDRAGQVGQRGAGVRGADVDADDDAGAGVERDQRRRPAAGGDAVADRHDQAEPHQHVDPGGDRGPGQPAGGGQLGAGPRTPVPEEVEDVAGPHGGSQAPATWYVQQTTFACLSTKVRDACHSDAVLSEQATRPRRVRRGRVRGACSRPAACPSSSSATRSSTTSTSSCGPARSSAWSARTAPASPR